MWRKTTGAKPSPQASKVLETAKTPTASPAGPITRKPDGEDSSLAAAAVALEKQLAQEQAPNADSTKANPDGDAASSAAANELLAAVLAATSAPPRGQASKEHPRSDQDGSRIYGGIKIRGEISGTTDLFIDGEVQGKLCFGGASVTVGSSGRVQADIEAREIVVLGTVQGTLRAVESVRLGPQSRVKGNLLATRIAIEDGARLSGSVDMTRAGSASVAAIEPEPSSKANALGASV